MKEICITSDRLSEYALGILSGSERRRVELHVSSCTQCRLALQGELRMLREVRWTMSTVSQPDPRRIRQLMPHVPESSGRRWAMVFRQQFAPLAALVVILLSGWLWQANSDHSLSLPSSTPLLETAIATIPLANGPLTHNGENASSALHTIAAATPTHQEILATPAPHPTLPEKLPLKPGDVSP